LLRLLLSKFFFEGSFVWNLDIIFEDFIFKDPHLIDFVICDLILSNRWKSYFKSMFLWINNKQSIKNCFGKHLEIGTYQFHWGALEWMLIARRKDITHFNRKLTDFLSNCIHNNIFTSFMRKRSIQTLSNLFWAKFGIKVKHKKLFKLQKWKYFWKGRVI
jgi:hypothetical protein